MLILIGLFFTRLQSRWVRTVFWTDRRRGTHRHCTVAASRAIHTRLQAVTVARSAPARRRKSKLRGIIIVSVDNWSFLHLDGSLSVDGWPTTRVGIGYESVLIQLARCRLAELAISNAVCCRGPNIKRQFIQRILAGASDALYTLLD